MSYKGSRHRIGNYTGYGINLDDVRANTQRAREENTEHCEKHEQFNPYCTKCWAANEVLDKPTPDD